MKLCWPWLFYGKVKFWLLDIVMGETKKVYVYGAVVLSDINIHYNSIPVISIGQGQAVNIFKRLRLWNYWANFICSHFGNGDEKIYVFDSHDQGDCHANMW